MQISGIVTEALNFATIAHQGQKRKYTGEDYIVHPVAVMELVQTVPHTETMLSAALLHDVVEDTDFTLLDIQSAFGIVIRDYVEGLTDVSRLEDGNRKIRKAIDLRHTEQQCAEVQTIKLADLINNSCSIITQDPGFAEIYIEEKQKLLSVLTRGDKALHAMAMEIITQYYNTGE